MHRLKFLILGGTTEAGALARALAGDARFDAVLSLAGRTRSPALPPIPYRIGGFGGAEGLARYLRAEGVQALVNATHPFAARMSRNVVAAAALAGIPLLRVLRPAWVPGPGDCWTIVPDMEEAAEELGRAPRRIFLALGRQELAPFAARPWHDYLIRSVDPPDPALLPPRARTIAARGPFDATRERELLAAHGIEVVVCKNSGGDATAGKLAAARALGLPVVMVARPDSPAAETVPDADAALQWLLRRHAEAAPARRGV